MKDIVWLGSSKSDLMGMPQEVVEEFGYGLYQAQMGIKPDNAKPLRGGTVELIENFDTDTYRAVYTTKVGNSLYVLHCFKKKSNKGGAVPRPDRELIEKRLKMAQAHAKG